MTNNTILQMTKTDIVIPYNTLKQKLCNINNNEHRVLLKTIYTSLARVGEVVRGRYSDNPPLTKKNFLASDNLLITTMLTEKTNRVRRIPCARIDDSTQEFFKKGEPWYTEDIINYVSVFDNFVWDKSTRWAELVFQKYFSEYNQHIHLLRHWRASHLLQGSVTGVPVPERIVAKMGGWIGTKTLTSIYDGTTIEDYVRIDEGDHL